MSKFVKVMPRILQTIFLGYSMVSASINTCYYVVKLHCKSLSFEHYCTNDVLEVGFCSVTCSTCLWHRQWFSKYDLSLCISIHNQNCFWTKCPRNKHANCKQLQQFKYVMHFVFSSFKEWANTIGGVCRLCVCKLFCANRYITPKIARSLPNLHRMVSTWARIQVLLKVEDKVKGHVIGALLCRSRKSLLVAGKWPDCDQTCTRWSPGQPASRVLGVLKVKVKVKGHVIRAHLCWT